MARLLDWSEAKRQTELDACQHRHEENNALFLQARKEKEEES
jgi:hypothetical protein